jgi:hypothetical protein
MKLLEQLKGPARRRCLRLLRRVHDPDSYGSIFIRSKHPHAFRDAIRLHRAGLCTVAGSKWGWLAKPPVQFRELVLYASEADARKYHGATILPRTGRG